MLTDRRLTFADGSFRDDAIKCVGVDLGSSRALLGYAGLGVTGAGTEFSIWVSNVLRGQRITLDQAMVCLMVTMLRSVHPHLIKERVRSQVLLAPQFENGLPQIDGVDRVESPESHAG